MSPEIVGAIGILALIVLIFARMWIGLAMAFIGCLGCVYLQGIQTGFNMVGIVLYKNLSDYSLAALAMFMLMGLVVGATGMGEDLFKMADRWVGQLRGGLCMATVIACAFFAAVTGSSMTGAVIMGKVAYPEMKRHGYDDALATASIACAGTLGVMIPPSGGMIIYGLLTDQSIGELFMAGLLPGILLCVLFIVAVAIVSIVNPKALPQGTKVGFKAKITSIKNIWHTALLFLVMLGGIYKGVFTPTEAAAVGAFGAIAIGILRRRLPLKILGNSFMEALESASMLFLLLGGAFIFNKFMALSRLPFLVAGTIGHLALPPVAVLSVIIVLYLFLGMFMEIYSMLVLTIPIIYPSILSVGFDPIWFGVIAVLMIELGVVTPPVGLNVYVLSGTTDVPSGTIFRGIIPFCVAIFACVILLAIFPQIALFIPSTMK
jgi:C4-dicarboxylate transporter DctM subunit